MQAIPIPDELFARARQEATALGIDVTTYIVNLVSDGVQKSIFGDSELFTPAVIAELDEIVNDLDAGGMTYSESEVESHFSARREAWLSRNRG